MLAFSLICGVLALGDVKELKSGFPQRLPADLVHLAPSGKHQLLRLTKRSGKSRLLAAGRSYGGSAWEAAFPELLHFSCGISVPADTTVYSATAVDFKVAEVCSVIIPTSSDSSYYQLDVFDYSSAIPDAGSMASRFITSVSFGATREDISAYQSTFSNDPAAWISSQMDKLPTLHREFFRRRANKRFPTKISDDGLEYDNLKTLDTASQGHIHAAASPLIACTPGSRWTRFAFTKSDIGQTFVATPVSDRTYANSTFFVNIAHGSDCCSSNKAEVGRSAAANPDDGPDDAIAGTALTPKQCEAECKANDECNFFTHEPTQRICVYCSKCDLQAKTARGQMADFTSWRKTSDISAVLFGKLNVSIDHHPRTLVENSQANPFILRDDVPHPFKICTVEERVGGQVTYGADCSGFVANPAIAFDDLPTDSVVLKTRHLTDLQHAIHGVKILGGGSSTLSCSTAPMSGPQFAVHEPSGSFYMFDRRVALADNTVVAPSAKPPTALRYECPNVPKTFVNAHTCRTGVESCSPVSYSSQMFTLEEAIIKRYYTNASRHVHAIVGLALTEGADSSPCKSGASRWCARLSSASTCADRLDVASRRVVAAAVRAGSRETMEVRNSYATARNDIVRDVMIHEQCNAEAGAQVVVDGVCWEHVHKDELNVYDFTFWARAHDNAEATEALKEGSETVSAVAEVGSVRFQWNGSTALWAATVKDRRMQIHLLGRLGDTVDFIAMPLPVQDEAIARIIGAERKGGDASVEICGSHGEVANDPLQGNTLHLKLATDDGNWVYVKDETFDSAAPQDPIDGMVWQNVNLRAEDQLRQRMAWALSQTFVINETPLYRKKPGNEHFFAYYDIFVRHAFGNYRDVLREVSYSPMMGYMLTFVNSRSRKRTKTAPDENYAREAMQLFSMGLYRLHDNGTRMIDASGASILAYDIDDVASIAAGWTGFERQSSRANYEDSILMTQTSSAGASQMNVIDPMKIVGRNRDANPKRTPTSGYIGDGFPLCVDLPKRAFLKKGAKYRYLGRDPNPAKHAEPRDYGEGYASTSSSGPSVINRTTLRTDSELFKKLCGARSSPCRFKSELVLSENLQCDGLECDVDTVRVVKMSNAGVREDGERYNVYYEYLRQPCVVQSYFADPTVITGAKALGDTR
jgi:hypothetical protein